MKINDFATSGKTNPIQTQSNPTCSELVEPISNPGEFMISYLTAFLFAEYGDNAARTDVLRL